MTHLVDGSAEVRDANIWSCHEDPGRLIVSGDAGPVTSSKLKEGVPILQLLHRGRAE